MRIANYLLKMDVEQFIDLVRKRPCLYDYGNALSKNKKEKERSWREIATVMEMSSETAKNKWKNLKDNYSKHLKGTTATSGHYLKYLHWAWASNMEFMKKFLNLTSAASNNDQHNIHNNHESEPIDSAQFSSRSDSRTEDIAVIDSKLLQANTAMSRQSEFTPQTRNECKHIKNGQDYGYDGTDLIFLGYARAIKTFSVRRQAEIKLKIAKIITDEEVAHFEENSEYPESPAYYSQSLSPQHDPLNPKLTHEVQIKTEEI